MLGEFGPSAVDYVFELLRQPCRLPKQGFCDLLLPQDAPHVQSTSQFQKFHQIPHAAGHFRNVLDLGRLAEPRGEPRSFDVQIGVPWTIVRRENRHFRTVVP